jgi:flagellar basal body-associated protein FliL
MAEQPTDAPAAASPEKKPGKMVTMLIVAGLMIAEGVGVFFLAGVVSPPPPQAQAGEAGLEDEGLGADGLPLGDGMVEIHLADCTVTNRNGVKTYTVTISVAVLARAKDEELLTAMAERMKARIDDRVNFVVRSTDQKLLGQPGLETIKRHLQSEFEKIFGEDELIVEVLVPELIQSE